MTNVELKQSRKWRYWPGLLAGLVLALLVFVARGLADGWQDLAHTFRYGIEDELAWYHLAGQFLLFPIPIAIVVFIRNRFVK